MKHGWQWKRVRRAALAVALLALGVLVATRLVFAAPVPAQADVVVLVDTSTSIKQPGLDPERTSLLVTKLLADIVPGDLAVVRLLDLAEDGAWLPSRDTGKTQPCDEDPALICRVTEPAGDWDDLVRKNRYGALVRASRGDAAFKRSLEKHLEQRIHNSLFDLGFRAAQGIFDQRRGGPPRTVVWLSDGRSEHVESVRTIVAELRASKVDVVAIVFGKGDVALAQSMGLQVSKVSTSAELMKAFAGVFRGIVQAPYEWDRALAGEPAFEMRAGVDEAWVVAYGDASLSDAWLTDPGGAPVAATHGQDVWPSAGAYRVVYIQSPRAGRWTLGVAGGGPQAAYAVVQRSSLGPLLLEPKTAVSGAGAQIVAGIAAGADGAALSAAAIPAGLALEISIDGGVPIILADDGRGGDAVAGDGRFSATGVFPRNGSVPVRLRLHGGIVDRTVDAVVEVSGRFHCRGEPLHVDLGELRGGSRSCRPLAFTAEHTGQILFELELLRAMPTDHSLEIVAGGKTTAKGRDPVAIGPGEPIEVCLVTTASAPSSSAVDEPWARLRVAGSSEPDQAITLHLKWQVRGLSFWERWAGLILLILGILIVMFIVAGYIVPRRFSRALGVAIAPERDELEEQSPQPVAQWRGVGIGFYRNARAYVHVNYRLSGSSRGALAVLSAEASGTRVRPGKGQSLYRETADDGWESVPAAGRLGQRGDVFRSGERGPYLRVMSARRA